MTHSAWTMGGRTPSAFGSSPCKGEREELIGPSNGIVASM